ncbi:flagellar export chaperone FlgN [Priestia filamentosa]|uniref:flagellar protein FlgN n=1 Tax=Priestia filamentosa TaxID=1402861 RepID=UPI001FB44AAB|nr:flagellar protein FlgN [Priestia filamentosa]MED3724633.1 flagellar protein FlgN [Priestia filamentosa]UOE60819.1 flagellar export chaperone FlgN [Priestia filamentosa]
MNIDRLEALLEKLLSLHKSLLHLAQQKTECLKEENEKVLSKLINEEQSHIKAITKLEEARQREVLLIWEEPLTLGEIIEKLPLPQRAKYEVLKEELSTCLLALKERNELNQQLLYYSLQVVNMTIDMFGKQPKNLNYHSSQKERPSAPSRSMFDSKA